MKRLMTSAMAAALLVGWSAGEASAQDMMNRRASRFDLGVYAGGSVTSRWYETRTGVVQNRMVTDNDDSQAMKIGYAPIFGAHGTFWLNPQLGVRLHGAYMPSRLPFPSDNFFDIFPEDPASPNRGTFDRSGFVLNNYLYDLNVVFRPFFMRPGTGDRLASVYFFAGGGGLTTNVAGENRLGCEPFTLSQGACLSFEPDHATVGQGVLGAGMDLLRLGNSLALFGEVGLHGYNSPVHVGDGFLPSPIRVPSGGTVRIADDRFAVTTRINAGVKLLVGDLMPAMAAPAAMAPPPPPPPVPMEEMRQITVCVVEGTQLRNVQATFNPATGDTMVMMDGQQRPFGQAFPATTGYAAGEAFYINNEPITFQGRRYVRFGLPRVIGAQEVNRIGEYRGIQVFAETGATGAPQVIYLPVRTGCEFAVYQQETAIRVRG